MGDVATAQVIGNLTKAAAGETLQNNRVRAKFTVASSYYERGQDQRPKAFYECQLFCSQERWTQIQNFLTAGAKVGVWGQLKPRLSTGNDGTSKLWLNLDVDDFTMLGSKEGGGGAPQGQGQAQGQAQGGGAPQGQGGGAPAGGSPPGADPPLPQGWQQQQDPATGRAFFTGPNGQSQWDRPATSPPSGGPPGAPPAAQAPGGGYGGGSPI